MRALSRRVVSLILAIMVCFCLSTIAYAAGAAGTIGLSFGGVKTVVSGETITGNIYSYDIGGTDAFDVTFCYDSIAFSDIKAEATEGVTVLASRVVDNELSVVFMVDPLTADYSNLLNIVATAGPDEMVGSIDIISANAAKNGEQVVLTIAADDNTISIVHDGIITEFNITTLSRAMMFFMYDKTYPNWAAAAMYDIDGDGVIMIDDFIKIANAIIDAQRISMLKFSADGKFKILQMSDIQDYISPPGRPVMDQRTIALINAVLDAECPDLVVITGDHTYERGNMSAADLQEYIQQMVTPFEEHHVPWMITYGNHDEDSTPALNAGWNKIQQLAYYRSFTYNVNRASMSGAQAFEPNGRNTICVGDMYALIYDHDGKKPVYNVWALDSNRYDLSGYRIGTYDWIRSDQIQWYTKTSKLLEAKYGEKINSLMFYHIPTPDCITMWEGGS